MFQTLPAVFVAEVTCKESAVARRRTSPRRQILKIFFGTDDRVDPVYPASPKTVPGSGFVLLAGKGAPFEAPMANPG